jgi:hypothetical protein
MPRFDKNSPQIKFTSAAIKREAIILSKHEEIEKFKLKNLEINQRDSNEFE